MNIIIFNINMKKLYLLLLILIINLSLTNPQYSAIGACNKNTCKNGTCKTANTCTCNYGFAHINDKSTELCNYELKKQYIAFILELILFFGIGHIYCGRTVNFIVKLILMVLLVSSDFIGKYAINVGSYKTRKGMYIASYIQYAIIIIWQTVDMILFGLNVYRDGEGFRLLTISDT